MCIKWDKHALTRSKYTLTIYGELESGSPFSCPIYKISAELHVKQVENYSMKQINKQNYNVMQIKFQYSKVMTQYSNKENHQVCQIEKNRRKNLQDNLLHNTKLNNSNL